MYYKRMRRQTTAKWSIIFVFMLLSMLFSIFIPVLFVIRSLLAF